MLPALPAAFFAGLVTMRTTGPVLAIIMAANVAVRDLRLMRTLVTDAHFTIPLIWSTNPQAVAPKDNALSQSFAPTATTISCEAT